MNKLLLLLVCFNILIIMSGNVNAATPISSCGTISTPGDYYLTTDIINHSGTMFKTSCIYINTSDVTFDGMGHTIDGTDNIVSGGVVVFKEPYSPSPIGDALYNVTVKNLIVTDWGHGIFYNHVGNGFVINNTANSNRNGIRIEYYSRRNTIRNNIANNNTRFGFEIWAQSNYNYLVNNTANLNSLSGFAIGFSGTTGGNAPYGNILENNTASDNKNGFQLEPSYNSTLINNTASNNNYNGICITTSMSHDNTLNNNNIFGNHRGIGLFTNTYDNILEGNKISSNDYGIYLSNVNNQKIYNNIFNNSHNFSVFSSSNSWNTTKTSGTNIIGGKYLGGNVWLSPDGTGFSENCEDIDNDGICDSIFSLSLNNIDYLPLMYSVYKNSTIDILANQPIIVDASRIDTILEIITSQDVQGSIDITKTSNNPEGTSSLNVPSLDTYLEFDVSEDIESNITSVEIRYYYTDEEVINTGIDENSLGFYWWNETSSSWEMIDESMDWVFGTGVNSIENYVWANVSHFSIYAVVELPFFNAKLIKSKLSPEWRHGSAGLMNTLTAKVRVEGLYLVCRMDYEVANKSGSIIQRFSSEEIQYAVGDHEIVTQWTTPSIPGAYSITGTLYYGTALGNRQSNYKKLSHIGLV